MTIRRGKAISETAPPGDRPMVSLELQDLSARFGGVLAVGGVSASLTGRIVGIVGPNGAGKSTLLDCISGLTEMKGGVVGGSIRYDGLELRGLVPERRARFGIGRSFQHPLLVPMLTVGEHLRAAIGRPGSDRHDFDDLVSILGLGRWIQREIGELPYGIRKLLDIGRALAVKPRLLLCDEPLSGLDERARDEMLTTLSSVVDTGTAIVVVEHDFPRLARLADELIVMDFGKLIGQGSPVAIAADQAIRSVFLGADTYAG